MTIALTGASGQLGILVAHAVLDRLGPERAGELVVISRKPEALGELTARGAEARPGDFDDPATLSGAFAGVDRLLLVSSDAVGDRVAGHQRAIDAAVAAGVRHLLYTSVTRPEPANPAGVVPDHAATEAAIRASGLAWTMLRNNLYADMQLPGIKQAAAAGRLVTNVGDGRTAFVTRADCAAVAAAVLAGEGHEGEEYDVTGPDAVGAADLAALAGPAVQVVDLDDEAFVAGLESAGMPAQFAGLLASFGHATREGFMGAVSTVVPDLTGRPAESLRSLLPV